MISHQKQYHAEVYVNKNMILIIREWVKDATPGCLVG